MWVTGPGGGQSIPKPQHKDHKDLDPPAGSQKGEYSVFCEHWALCQFVGDNQALECGYVCTKEFSEKSQDALKCQNNKQYRQGESHT
nr:hypothetical protein [Candidatus Mycoplasma haematolamae]